MRFKQPGLDSIGQGFARPIRAYCHSFTRSNSLKIIWKLD